MDFHTELIEGWFLSIDKSASPFLYTLRRGKRSMTFNSNVLMNLCLRNYGLRLTKGRRQMHLPPDLLQAFVDNALFFQWFDPHCETSEAAWMDEFLDDMEELDD